MTIRSIDERVAELEGQMMQARVIVVLLMLAVAGLAWKVLG